MKGVGVYSFEGYDLEQIENDINNFLEKSFDEKEHKVDLVDIKYSSCCMGEADIYYSALVIFKEEKDAN